jgi:hypothetical protein
MSLINTFLDGEIRTAKNEELKATREGLAIANEGKRLANEGERAANREANEYQAKLIQKDEELAKIKKKLYNAQDDLEEYKQLLCKPMLEIAQQNGNFKETYDKQMQIMADWMVSQKAFKELAIQFGFDKGLKPDQVIEMGLDKKIDVLENKHDESHNTNVGDSVIIGPHREQLIKKHNDSRKK